MNEAENREWKSMQDELARKVLDQLERRLVDHAEGKASAAATALALETLRESISGLVPGDVLEMVDEARASLPPGRAGAGDVVVPDDFVAAVGAYVLNFLKVWKDRANPALRPAHDAARDALVRAYGAYHKGRKA